MLRFLYVNTLTTVSHIRLLFSHCTAGRPIEMHPSHTLCVDRYCYAALYGHAWSRAARVPFTLSILRAFVPADFKQCTAKGIHYYNHVHRCFHQSTIVFILSIFLYPMVWRTFLRRESRCISRVISTTKGPITVVMSSLSQLIALIIVIIHTWNESQSELYWETHGICVSRASLLDCHGTFIWRGSVKRHDTAALRLRVGGWHIYIYAIYKYVHAWWMGIRTVVYGYIDVYRL